MTLYNVRNVCEEETTAPERECSNLNYWQIVEAVFTGKHMPFCGMSARNAASQQ